MKAEQNQSVMAVEIKRFIEQRAVDKKLKLLKDKPKKNEKTGAESGGINEKLTKLIENKKALLSREQSNEFKKLRKDKNQSNLEFQVDKYGKLSTLAKSVDFQSYLHIKDEYKSTQVKIRETYQPQQWLSDNCKNAAGVSFATHVAKLTHSSIKGATNIYDADESSFPGYLTTSTLREKYKDGALDDAKFSPVAALLKLSDSERTLGEYVLDNDVSPFLAFTQDQDIELATQWVTELKQAFESKGKSSHILARQVYWPVEAQQYHLLLPMKSSSLAQALYIEFSRFFEKRNEWARKQKNVSKYSPDIIAYYPKKAVVKVTASNHTNASELNGKRGGRLQLISCFPPDWQTKIQPPKNQKSLFAYPVNQRTEVTVDELRRLLLSIKFKRVSIKEPEAHKEVMHLVEAITEEVLDYVALIQSLTEFAGWSAESKLQKSHQYLLDIYYADEEFQEQRKAGAWKKEISQNFADWLNARLKYKSSLKLGPIQAALWRNVFQERLRLFLAEMEVEE